MRRGDEDDDLALERLADVERNIAAPAQAFGRRAQRLTLRAAQADRVVLKKERIAHWLSVGAKPSDRVHRFLHAAEMLPAPVRRDQPKKSAPKAKAQERAKALAEAADKPAEGGGDAAAAETAAN